MGKWISQINDALGLMKNRSMVDEKSGKSHGQRLHPVRADSDKGDRRAAQLGKALEVGLGVRRKVFEPGDPGGVGFPPGKRFVNRYRPVPCLAVGRRKGIAEVIESVPPDRFNVDPLATVTLWAASVAEVL